MSNAAWQLRRLLRRLVAPLGPGERRQAFDEGYAAGYAAARRQEGISDGPGGISWEQIVKHAAANPQMINVWEREFIDSVSRSLRYGIPPTPRQCAKLEWLLHNRFKGTVT